MRKVRGVEVSWVVLLELVIVTFIVVLFWNVVLVRMFELPKMSLFQSCLVVLSAKVWKHLI